MFYAGLAAGVLIALCMMFGGLFSAISELENENKVKKDD